MTTEQLPTDLKIPVSRAALYAVLSALNGQDHYIRELQATRGEVYKLVTGQENPIDLLVREYNAWAEEQRAAAQESRTTPP